MDILDLLIFLLLIAGGVVAIVGKNKKLRIGLATAALMLVALYAIATFAKGS